MDNLNTNTVGILRPLLSATWSTWINDRIDSDSASPEDKLSALCAYAEVKGTCELSQAEVERICWAVDNIRQRASWLDHVVQGECLIVPQWIYDDLHGEIRPLEPSFFARNDKLINEHRRMIAVQSLLLEVVEGGARLPKGEQA